MVLGIRRATRAWTMGFTTLIFFRTLGCRSQARVYRVSRQEGLGVFVLHFLASGALGPWPSCPAPVQPLGISVPIVSIVVPFFGLI